nr:MAG TPA: hypothetical protein [Caudoviricetes sp.]
MALLILICWIIFLAPLAIVLVFLGRYKEFWQWLGLTICILAVVGISFIAFIIICLI